MRGTELTERQQEVLDHIRKHIRKRGIPPSRSELGRTLKLVSKSAIAYHLQALERKGWIQLTPGLDRGIQLLREGTPVFDPDELPDVAAGTPILADESRAVMRVPDELTRRLHPQANFYLVVRGDSMSCVGYRTGDIIAIKRTPDASEGDIVVARIGTEITVKCFHRPSNDRVELRPCSENPEHCTIVIDGQTEDWEIVGVVVGAMVGARPTSGC
ncbi:MAG: transcriptional repressor LexA [Rhodococcus sp.]|nr:transcriptional repressor LexA [Rhodococcus sp. (in: high G+C Gram-positive bacteria)]